MRKCLLTYDPRWIKGSGGKGEWARMGCNTSIEKSEERGNKQNCCLFEFENSKTKVPLALNENVERPGTQSSIKMSD